MGSGHYQLFWVQVHDSVVVTRVLAYWRRVVSWVRLQWLTLLVKLPVHHQTRAEAAAAWLQVAWYRAQHLAGQVCGGAARACAVIGFTAQGCAEYAEGSPPRSKGRPGWEVGIRLGRA